MEGKIVFWWCIAVGLFILGMTYSYQWGKLDGIYETKIELINQKYNK